MKWTHFYWRQIRILFVYQLFVEDPFEEDVYSFHFWQTVPCYQTLEGEIGGEK